VNQRSSTSCQKSKCGKTKTEVKTFDGVGCDCPHTRSTGTVAKGYQQIDCTKDVKSRRHLDETDPRPPPATAGDLYSTRPAPLIPRQLFDVHPANFSDTMTVTCLVSIDGVEQTTGTLVALVGNEVRARQDTPYLASFGPYSGSYLYALTVYTHSGKSGRAILNFRFVSGDKVLKLVETADVAANAVRGSMLSPFLLTTSAPKPLFGA